MKHRSQPLRAAQPHWQRRHIRFIAGAIAAAACAGVAVPGALAQEYPSKPIRIIQGAAAGGSLDTSARIVGQKLSEYLGQPVLVEARPGASGTIANSAVAKSPPDGHTLLVMAATGSIQSVLKTNLPYDLERDLVPISLLTVTPLAVVLHPLVPARNVKELIALARKEPRKLNYGSSGIGSTSHLAGEALNLLANVQLVHVPFKGGAESVIAAATGDVDMSLPGITAVPALARAGKVRAIAVTTLERSKLMPELPTLDESGFRGYDFSSWAALLAPAGVPRPLIERLNSLVTKVLRSPDLASTFDSQGLIVRVASAPETAQFIRREMALNRKLVKQANIRAD